MKTFSLDRRPKTPCLWKFLVLWKKERYGARILLKVDARKPGAYIQDKLSFVVS